MKIRNVILLIIAIIFINGCGVSQEDYDKLNSEYMKLTNDSIELVSKNKQLTKELEECKNGAKKIIARIEKANKENKYSDAVTNINKLYEKFPESPKNKKYQKLLKKLNKKILIEKDKIAKKKLAEKKKKEKEAKEKRRLANLNNTGMWKVKFFVDNFGEPTTQGYIINSSK